MTAKLTFDQALTEYTRSTKESMEYALLCSHMALDHFAEHGDTVYFQRFHDAINKNYGRQSAFRVYKGPAR